MSTRGNIAILLKSEDINKKLSGHFGSITTDTSHPYLQIYNHHDSYPSGLGKDLLDKYNSYEEVLALILDGDCSYPGDPYCGRGESYDDDCPTVMTAPCCDEEYLYVFKNNKWYIDEGDGELKLLKI